jgi:hypothetical protein
MVSVEVAVHVGHSRRKSIRFPLHTPVIFWWTNVLGERHLGEGLSRDISEEGAFVFAADCPPLGSSVDLKLDLEASPNSTEHFPIQLHCQVVRVERPNGEMESGFAVSRR